MWWPAEPGYHQDIRHEGLVAATSLTGGESGVLLFSVAAIQQLSGPPCCKQHTLIQTEQTNPALVLVLRQASDCTQMFIEIQVLLPLTTLSGVLMLLLMLLHSYKRAQMENIAVRSK